MSARYEKGSIILTSNKHVRDWPEIFAGDEILTTAILDRLLHHIHIIHIDGHSYRLREIDGLLKQPTAPVFVPASFQMRPRVADQSWVWAWACSSTGRNTKVAITASSPARPLTAKAAKRTSPPIASSAGSHSPGLRCRVHLCAPCACCPAPRSGSAPHKLRSAPAHDTGRTALMALASHHGVAENPRSSTSRIGADSGRRRYLQLLDHGESSEAPRASADFAALFQLDCPGSGDPRCEAHRLI